VKLNVGCGKKVLPGYVNVDLYVEHPQVLKADVRKLPFNDGIFDEVLAEDILEHFPRLEWRAALAEWVRVLKLGGTITIRSPDMRALGVDLFNAGEDDERWEWLDRRIFGGQGDGIPDPHRAMYHFTGFHDGFLRRHCEKTHRLAFVDCSHASYNFKLTMRKP
jgi:hypothetical protein